MKIVILCFLLIFILFPSFSQTKKLEIWGTSAEFEELYTIKKILKKEKKIDLVFEIQVETRSKYIQSVISGTGPDLVIGAHDWIGEFAKNGVISEINLSKEDINSFYPISIQGFSYNGKLYGIPYCIESIILFYNKKIIKDVPETWEEILEFAKKYTNAKENKFGFLYGVSNNFYTNYPFIASQGGYIFGFKDGKYDINDIGLDNEGSLIGAKFIKKLATEKIVPISTGIATIQTSFLDGKVAIIMDGPWNIPLYERQLGKENLGIAKLPTLNGKPSVPFVGSRGIMLNSVSKNKDLAKIFLTEYIMTKKGQLEIFKKSGRPPAHIEASKDAIKENPNIKIILDTALKGTLMPNIKAMAVVWNYAAGMIDKILIGESTVEDALKTGTKSIREEISKKQSKYE